MRKIKLPEVGDFILTEKCITHIEKIDCNGYITISDLMVIPYLGQSRMFDELKWNKKELRWELQS